MLPSPWPRGTAGGAPAPWAQTSVYDVVRGWVPELSTPSRLQRWWPHWELPHWGLQLAGSPSPGAWLPSSASRALHSTPEIKERLRQKLEALIGVSVPQPADDIDLTRVLWENLADDLRFWKERPKPKIANLVRLAVRNKAFINRTNIRRLVLIQDNTMHFPLMPPGEQRDCRHYCDPQLRALVAGFKAAVSQYNTSFPDLLFLVNVFDYSACSVASTKPRLDCFAPVLSITKILGDNADILGPPLLGPDAHDVVERSLPWDQKIAKAFFRGVPSCGRSFDDMCARTWFARLASTNHSDRLDAGLIEEYNQPFQIKGDPVLRDGNGPLPVLPRTDLSMLPRYRYLLNLDGHAAPYRTALLLATNSVMLKQQSGRAEWYYRSLYPWVHYIPILHSSKWDAFPAMQWVDTHQEAAQAITKRATRFALRYTTYKARLLYWMYAMHAYKALFKDQEELLKTLRGLGEEERRQLLLSAAAPQAHC